MSKYEPEINDLDLEEIARLIKEGNTSGRLDSEEEDQNGKIVSKFISWELKTEIWTE